MPGPGPGAIHVVRDLRRAASRNRSAHLRHSGAGKSPPAHTRVPASGCLSAPGFSSLTDGAASGAPVPRDRANSNKALYHACIVGAKTVIAGGAEKARGSIRVEAPRRRGAAAGHPGDLPGAESRAELHEPPGDERAGPARA